MNCNTILIVTGEPNSVFLEIFFKALKKKINKNPIILISSQKLLKLQMNELKFKKKIRILNVKKLNNYRLDNNSINLINVKLNQKKSF